MTIVARLIFIIVFGLMYLYIDYLAIKNYLKLKEKCTKVVSATVKDMYEYDPRKKICDGVYLGKGTSVNKTYKAVFEFSIDCNLIVIESKPFINRKYEIGERVELLINPKNYNEYIGRDNDLSSKYTILFGSLVMFSFMAFFMLVL